MKSIPILTEFEATTKGLARLTKAVYPPNTIVDSGPYSIVDGEVIFDKVKILSSHCSYFLDIVDKDDITPWMADTLAERWSHEKILKDVKGRIAIGGLGLGLFFHYLNYGHQYIDVYEINKDIIDLISPYYSHIPSVNFIHTDMDEYSTSRGYDYMYIDYHTWGYWEETPQEVKESFKIRFPNAKDIRFWEA